MRGGAHNTENEAAFDAEAYLATVGVGRRVIATQEEAGFLFAGGSGGCCVLYPKGFGEADGCFEGR